MRAISQSPISDLHIQDEIQYTIKSELAFQHAALIDCLPCQQQLLPLTLHASTMGKITFLTANS